MNGFFLKQERIYSHHLDDVQVASCVSKCKVSFLPASAASIDKADYFARLFYDHKSRAVRPLKRADMAWQPFASTDQLEAEQIDVDALQQAEAEQKKRKTEMSDLLNLENQPVSFID